MAGCSRLTILQARSPARIAGCAASARTAGRCLLVSASRVLKRSSAAHPASGMSGCLQADRLGGWVCRAVRGAPGESFRAGFRW